MNRRKLSAALKTTGHENALPILPDSDNLVFESEKEEGIQKLGEDKALREISLEWTERASRGRYSYHFTWMGRPIIQLPTDIVALQELVWKVKPDLVIETGIARGGSLIFYAALLELIGGEGRVLGIDIDIRKHNRNEIEQHPMSQRISMLQGSSISPEIMRNVHEYARAAKRVMVVLDSNHTHEHVLEELRLYSPLVKKGSYLVVLDTIVEDMPADFVVDRPWGKGNNPKTAVTEFLRESPRFEIDQHYENKLLITYGPSGYLKCVRD